MTKNKDNLAQASVKKAFSVVEGLSSQYRKLVEDFAAKSPSIDDSQLSTMFDMVDSYREILEELALHPLRLANTESKVVKNHFNLLKNSAKRLIGKPAETVVKPEDDDQRFQDKDWEDKLYYNFIKQFYLINANAAMELVGGLEGNESHTREQLVFYTRQVVNALAPTNFALTNPEVVRTTIDTKGVNLIEGAKQFWQDLKRNPRHFNVTMTDFSAFEVGKNVASTPGKVVYQNELMQLIQYTPTTATVHKTPLLIVPPWINKFYILDMKAKNSYIKWLVDQGLTVFVVSWINPGPKHRDMGFEDYMTKGPLAAFDAIKKATGEPDVNVVGYCIGGTLLGSTLAYLAKQKTKNPVKSATYLTSLLDFSDPGGIGVFINEQSIAGIEKALEKSGYYDGRAMAFSFNLLRENTLFWSFFVNNYLKGEKPAAFDLLYWNSDSTNLPGKMHSFYLRNMYLENKLIKPNALTLLGTPIDLSKIKTPAFFLSTVQDHIAKWKTTYKGALVHSGPTRFVLSGSGHIAGVVNPPAGGKYGYWTNDKLPESADDWFAGTEQHAGSWWPEWKTWLEQYAGPQVPAREPGDRELEVIEDAPGSYVKLRIADVINN